MEGSDLPMEVGSFTSKCSLQPQLENIDENCPASWLSVSCAPPETPTESMEFLGRSWSVSAMELSKALSNTKVHSSHDLDNSRVSSIGADPSPTPSVLKESLAEHLPSEGSPPISPRGNDEVKLVEQLPSEGSPPISPRGSDEVKELFLLHQALNSEFLSSQQLFQNGIYKSILRGKTIGRWLKDQKERKKHEIRTQNAQLHAAVSVAGVAAAVAAFTASNALPETSAAQKKTPSKTSAALASAAALVASHCIEIAEEMGADHNHILTVVDSAIDARTNGDIMTLTAGAATALRGAAILRTRLQKRYGRTTFTLADEKGEGKESNVLTALNFVSRGAELLKRTRKGALHWKQVSFDINSNMQVVAKMKSKYMAGTFTKKKTCIVSGVYCDIQAWPRREDSGNESKAYYGIKTADRIIEFECRNNDDKQMWTEGIQHMLNCNASVTSF